MQVNRRQVRLNPLTTTQPIRPGYTEMQTVDLAPIWGRELTIEVPLVDAEGAPVPGATVVVSFNAPNEHYVMDALGQVTGARATIPGALRQSEPPPAEVLAAENGEGLTQNA